MRPFFAATLCSGLLTAGLAQTSSAQTGLAQTSLPPAAIAPPGFAVEKIVGGLDPAGMAIAPDGRIFISEKHGRVRVVKQGQLLDAPFHTFAVDNVNERGLMGIAFAPDFAHNKRIYFYYTSPTPKPHNRVSFIVDGGNDHSVGKETVVLDLTDLSDKGNHNGGGIGFGLDGKLLVSVGENANGKNAQNPGNLLGKLLRVNEDGTVPTDNPFVSDPAFSEKNRLIYCMGLRNPYAFAVQPETGRIYINDVGNARWEEIDEVKPGRNFGWPDTEGTFDAAKFPKFANPIFTYTHTEGKNSITGGAFYGAHSGGFPAAYVGKYFYADYAGNYIGVVDPATHRGGDFITGVQTRPIQLAVGADGILYVLARGGMGGGSVPDNTASTSGALWAVRYTGILPPELVVSTDAITVPEAGKAAVTVSLSRASASAVKVTVRKISGSANVSVAGAVFTLAPGAHAKPKTLAITCARDADSSDGDALFSIEAVNFPPRVLRAHCPDPDPQPTIVSRAVTAAIVGVPYQLAVRATGKPAPTLTLAAGPPGMVLDAPSGALRFTPATAGTAHVRVQAHNTVGRDAVLAFDLTVAPADAPVGVAARQPVKPFLNMPDRATGTLPVRLSETGVFADTAHLLPAPGLLPYDVNSSLWSDGAAKERWIAVPTDGAPYEPWEQITFAATGEWNFPRGTVFVKHFELRGAAVTRLETRLLVIDATGGAYGVTYKWRTDGSDADLLPDALDEAHIIATASGKRSQVWSYPGRPDCLACHTKTAGYVLGVNTRQLNRSFTYPQGNRTALQLQTWDHIGMFAKGAFDARNAAGYAKMVPVSAADVDATTRVRSYLDANCAFCHRPGGAPTPFDLRFDTPLANQGIVGGAVLSPLNMKGVHVVTAGDVGRSMMHLRMAAQDTSRMPPLARNTADSEALNLLASWIAALPH